MVEAGLRVRMLDGGADQPPYQPPTGTIASFRTAPDRWAHQFGADLSGLRAGDFAPKAATPHARSITASFRDFADLDTRGFFAFAGLAPGGLSGVWGALTARFDAPDLRDYPITLTDLAPSYDAVSARIGMTSGGSPFARPLSRHLNRILDRFDSLQPAPTELRMRPAENAVLAHPMNGRGACVRCGLCLWGCQHGSIYDSASDLARLRQRPNFAFEPGALVRRLRHADTGHVLKLHGDRTLRAPLLVLAAGTLATTALVFDRLGHVGKPVPLLNNPVAAMAFLAPARFARDLPEQAFSLAQIYYETPLGEGETAAGALYSADALPLDVFARRMPFTRPTALRLARLLAPALVLATCYLPSRFSRNTITVGRNGDRLALSINGETTRPARLALKAAKRKLSAGLWRLGALPLPGAFAIGTPGSDEHYAGTIPMR